MKLFSEFFWSESSATAAGRRLEKKGYTFRVRYAMRGDGSHDWLLEVFG